MGDILFNLTQNGGVSVPEYSHLVWETLVSGYQQLTVQP